MQKPTVQTPTDEDRKNYNYHIKESKFYEHPETFLKMGQRVRAKFRVWDLPNNEERGWGWVSAEAGEEGTVVHVEEGYWPTVRFDKTGHATCVTDFEVEPVDDYCTHGGDGVWCMNKLPCPKHPVVEAVLILTRMRDHRAERLTLLQNAIDGAKKRGHNATTHEDAHAWETKVVAALNLALEKLGEK